MADPIVEALQASHPVLRHLNRENLQEYLALIVPHVLLKDAQFDGAILDNPMALEFATDAGAIILHHFEQEALDSDFFFILCDYFRDQALLSRLPDLRQIVILDTVMDSRVFRLESLKDCRVFELHPNADVFAEKERCVRDNQLKVVAKERIAIHVDLTADAWHDTLLAHGFKALEPTFWMVGNAVAHMAPEHSARMLSHIDALSAPGSQIYADMSSGHEITFIGGHGETTSLRLKPSRGADAMYGDTAHVFAPLSAWTVELLARRDVERKHFGSMWDQAKLGRRCVADSELAYLGPWYVVRFTKPTKTP